MLILIIIKKKTEKILHVYYFKILFIIYKDILKSVWD